jgi:hypothetical protein
MVAADAIRAELAHSSSLADRALLLEELATALFAALEVSALKEVLAERASLSIQLGDARAVRERLEFDTIEASMLGHDNPTTHLPRMKQLLQSDQLDVGRRIRAARMLMIAADMELDGELALFVRDENLRISPPDLACALLHSQTTLIYDTVYGDPRDAVDGIARLQQLLDRTEPCWQATLARINVSLSQTVVGTTPLDVASLEQRYEECCRARMLHIAVAIAGRIAHHYVDLADVEQASLWVTRAESLAARPGYGRVSPDYLTAKCSLALLTSDFEVARRAIREMPACSSRFEAAIFRNTLIMHRLRVEQIAQGQQATGEELDSLLSWHLRARRHGRHDDHMEVLWVALVLAGRAAEASTLLYDYLVEWRRERVACPFLLVSRTADDPAWTLTHYVRGRGYCPTSKDGNLEQIIQTASAWPDAT